MSALLTDLGLFCRVPELGVVFVEDCFVIAVVASSSAYGGVSKVDFRDFAAGAAPGDDWFLE